MNFVSNIYCKILPNYKFLRILREYSRYQKNLNFFQIRSLSTSLKKLSKPLSIVSQEEHHDFMAVYPDILRDLTNLNQDPNMSEIIKRFEEVIHYNVPNGKKQRALTVISAYKMLEKPKNLTQENIRLANILGWCLELLQGFYVIIDDIVDQSETRRGRLCWYKNNNVGLNAVNDGLLLENGIFLILKKYFSNHPNYVQILEIFHDSTIKSSIGEILDTQASNHGKPNFDIFTMKTYKTITKYKAYYNVFHLPISLAFYLAKCFNLKQPQKILFEMGEFFQIQEDFLDCFGNPEKTGKIGSDIKQGTCTWLAVKALEKASPVQKQLMINHYGKKNLESINIIMDLYKELKLPEIYAQFEEEKHNIIKNQIHQIDNEIVQKLFLKLLAQIYKRDC